MRGGSYWSNLPKSRGRRLKFGVVGGANPSELNQFEDTMLLPGFTFHFLNLVQLSNEFMFNNGSRIENPDGSVEMTEIKGFLFEDRGFGSRINGKNFFSFLTSLTSLGTGPRRARSLFLRRKWSTYAFFLYVQDKVLSQMVVEHAGRHHSC